MRIRFRHTYSSATPPVVGASASISDHKARIHPGQDALASPGALTHLHSYRMEQCRHANSPHVCIFGVWEDTSIPRENSRRCGENVKTQHQQWPRA